VNKANDLKRSTSISRSAGLHSHPIDTANKVAGSGPRSPGSQTKPRGPVPQAREARVPRESLADFAEFIRATGPNGETANPVARVNAPGTVRNFSGPIPNSKGSIDSSRMSATSNRNRFQARDATVDYKDDNSDLIDFIRRGPPSAHNNPRIPRTVAPFRTTQDSDQMTAAVGGRAVDAMLPDIRYSAASTNITESSMNSSSALLKKDRISPTTPSGGNMLDDADMMPKRKTRRVKDPYAIDFSDEDDMLDDDMPARGKPRQAAPKEESLADFLRSVEPPPDSSPLPLGPPQTQSMPRKKASAPSLMARFTRSSSSSSQFGLPGSKKSPTTATPVARSLSSRAGGGKGYIPIQVNMPPGYDKHTPPLPSSPLAGGGGAAASRPKVPMKKFEPRDAQPVMSRGTSELAQFLRASGPPPGPGPAIGYGNDGPPNENFKGWPRRKKSALA